MKLCIILAIAFAFGLGKVISISTENGTNADELEQRRGVLRNMTQEIWQFYMKELNRSNDSSSSVKVWSEPTNRVILNIMTTLWTMGLKEEFSQGREWISNNFGNLSQVETAIHVRQYMNEFVGGLLSCYALTNDTMFRDKAFEIASLLQSGYDNQTGIENYAIPSKAHKLMKLPKFVGLSEFGGSALEARYLSSLAPEQFADRTSLWRAFLRNQTADSSNNRVLLRGFDAVTGNFSGDLQSLTSFQTLPFYASLVKAYAQSNGTDLEAIEMYLKAIETAVQLGIITVVNGTGLSYIRDYTSGIKQFDKFMYYKGCNYGALLRIGADALETIREHNQTIASKTDQQLNETIAQLQILAEQITETCHFAANQTAAKLLLPLLYLNEQDEVTIDPKDLSWLNYKFDSGLEESYFVLWRSTEEPKYLDYAWELTQAYKSKFSLYKKNLNLELYSAGFKYLYLIFSEDTVLPLDQWVFTSLGHPLPICGRKGTLPKC